MYSHVEITDILAVIRSSIYIWVALEAIIVSFIYFIGYKNIKKSNIIYWIQLLFLSLTIYFIGISFLPIIQALNHEAWIFAVNIVTLSIVPVGISIRRFRHYSLTQEKHLELPNTDSIPKDFVPKEVRENG